MSRRAKSEPDLTEFWKSVRELLFKECGQAGKRNRQTMLQRRRLAENLGLEDVTIRAFLNGSQKSLGEFSRRRLCSKWPVIEKMYYESCGATPHAPLVSGAESASHPDEGPAACQLTLEFEGFDTPILPISFRIRPGRESVVNVKFQQRSG
jgi:hypothetical protein